MGIFETLQPCMKIWKWQFSNQTILIRHISSVVFARQKINDKQESELYFHLDITKTVFAQSAGAVEYSDYFSAER